MNGSELKAKVEAEWAAKRDTPVVPSLKDAEFEAQVEIEETLILAREEARRRVEARKSPDVDLDALYLDRDQLDGLSSPAPLIPDTLPRHAYGVLRGRDQSYKSFVALDWALTLATGTWWNLLPVEQTRVLYIAGEGAWGLRQRLAAWEASRNRRIEPAWFTVRQVALNLHRPGKAFDHLLEHVREGGYGLVVIDTLRRVSGAADGNSSEMGTVVDNIDRIKHATAGGSVLVVAHTDKGDSDSRGYSGIEDDADFVWHAKRDGFDLDLELTKMKDGPDGMHVYMQARPVLESLVLAPVVRTSATDQRNTESEMKLLAFIAEVFPDGSFVGAIRDSCEIPRSTFQRALSSLVAQGKVLKSGSQQRPFYSLPSLAGPVGVSVDPDAQVSAVPVESHRVPLVSRPLGSETGETPGEHETAGSTNGASR